MTYVCVWLSQHLERPGIVHWKACLHLLRYIRGTLLYGISFRKGSADLAIYTDADFANCPDIRRYYTGYVLRIGTAVVSWRSSKQPTVSSSTTEAESKALYEGIQEATWFAILLSSIGRPAKSSLPVLCDNQAQYHWARIQRPGESSRPADMQH